MNTAAIFTRLQATGLAKTIGGSTNLTAFLSGIHLIGMTMIAGGALMFATRAFRLAADPDPAVRVRTVEVRAITTGLIVSVVTGVLLVLPRLRASFDNPVFVTKMLLLVAAAAWHLSLGRRAARTGTEAGGARMTAALELLLWYGVVLAGCAFILYEE
jgi:hypothetical protein